MVAGRSVTVAFGFGLFWSVALVAITAAAARFLPVSSTMTASVGLAICGALACNKLFMSSQYFRTPEPVASVSRQMLAEGVAAFIVLLVAGGILLR
jgi:hypothetical protein